MELSKQTKSLEKRTKKLELTDRHHDDEGAGGVGAFYEQFSPVSSNYFQICPGKRKSNKAQVILHSDAFINQTSVLCGFDNDQLATFDISEALASEVIELPPKSGAIQHPGLSYARCSKATPQVFYSSSTEDGKINLWDGRVKSTKPAQSFTAAISGADKIQGTKKKPILTFDVSPGDQFLCAGTELVDEDSFLLFWDLRSTNLMGAYWESHSDDITSIRFHPRKPTSLASGSTDGLLNVFNLLETSEEDALIYSFNTETSVEKITWNSPASKPTSDHVACITHLNDIRVWDVENGDVIAECNRSEVSKAMQRSNPDTVYLNDSYTMPNGNLGIFSCSLSGDSCGVLEVENSKLTPRSLFLTETSVIQSTAYLPRDNRWITFGENGNMKIWSLEMTTPGTQQIKTPGKDARFKPY